MSRCRYQKGKTNRDFTEARGSEWQRHQLGRMQVCTSLQTDNHASILPQVFYRPDALPAAQPTASKHWRNSSEGITIRNNAHVCVSASYISWRRGTAHICCCASYCCSRWWPPRSIDAARRAHSNKPTTAMCQPFTTTTFAKHAFRCSAPAVWNSLQQTVLSSDSVAVLKLRLKTFLFSQAFSSFSAD